MISVGLISHGMNSVRIISHGMISVRIISHGMISVRINISRHDFGKDCHDGMISVGLISHGMNSVRNLTELLVKNGISPPKVEGVRFGWSDGRRRRRRT